MTKKLFFILILALTSLIGFEPAGTVWGAEKDPQKILKAIQKKHAGLVSLRAEYSRVTNTPAMEGVFQSSSKHLATGIFTYKKPAKLILDQDTPRPETLVTDGSTVWWYIPEEKVVHRYANVDVAGQLKPLLDFLGGLGGLEGQYKVKVTPAWTGRENSHRLDLTRLEGVENGPSGLTVWFAPETYNLLGFRLESLTGETTVFTLTKQEINPAIDDGKFRFRIPEGVQVLDEGGD